jgi:hypothetical protein
MPAVRRHVTPSRSTVGRWGGALLAVALLGILATAALAGTANWGFGVSGQKSATITWQPDTARQNVNAVLFTLPVKVRSAKTRQGHKCTISSTHPHQARCAISPATDYGYVDVLTRTRMPCKGAIGFSVRVVGTKRFVRQAAIQSGNGCG